MIGKTPEEIAERLSEVRDELRRIASKGGSCPRFEWHLRTRRGRYVSGIPYLFTCYPERAFVFRTRSDARRVAKLATAMERCVVVRGRAVADVLAKRGAR